MPINVINLLQDPVTKNWLLFLKRDQIFIGYWPSKIFTRLSSKANKLVFGGVVGYLNNQDKPPMGSGHFPIEGRNKACFFSNIKNVDKQTKIQDIDSEILYPFSSSRECYYVGPYLETGPGLGDMFFFGGPGYC